MGKVRAVAFSGGERTDVQAMLDAVIAISSELDLHSVLNTIVRSCCSVTGARLGFLGVLDENGELLDQVVHGLGRDEVGALLGTPMGRGLIGHLMRHPYPVRFGRDDDVRPAGLEQLDSFLGMPLRVGQEVFGTLYLAEKQGGEFSEADESTVDALARVAGVAVANARRYRMSERRREWVEAAAQITESLHPPFRLDETLRQIVHGACRVARASLAVVVHGAEGAWDVPASEGADESALVELLEDHTHRIEESQASGELVTCLWDVDRTLVFAPLAGDLSYPGVLVVLVDRGHGRLTAEEAGLVSAYAAQASLALDRAMAIVERQEEAVVADRDRIARDLHDLVIQRLFATGLQLQGARRLTNPADLHARLDVAVTDLDQTIRDIRTTIFQLEHGSAETLRSDIDSLVREYEPTLGFAPTIRTSGAIDSLVDRTLGEHVLATLREALSNVARHAEAHSTTVELHVDPEQLLLVVADDGRGLGDGRRESGLRNLRRRAEEVGGTLQVGSAPTGGTRLEWRVPVS